MDMFDEESIKEFILEASELIEEAEAALLNLESGDDYQANFNIVFRAFHSIKGGAGMLGLDATNKIVHFLEDVLTKADKEDLFSPSLIDYFFEGIDSTKKSLAGEDSNFSFQSPFEAATEAKPQKPEVAHENKAPKTEYLARIFHIDDEPEIGEVVKDLLEAHDYHVTSFTSGGDMLKELKPGEVDIIVSDYNMPGLSGNDIIFEAKKIDPDVPTILLSGFLDNKVCIEAINNGAFALLEKPINPGLMYSVLQNASKSVKFSRLVNRSIKLLMYQFSDLDEFLTQSGKEHIRNTIKSELENLIVERNALRNFNKDSKKAA